MKKVYMNLTVLVMCFTFLNYYNLQSEIKYTDLEPDVAVSPANGGSQSYMIDLNSDNKIDFYLQINNMSEGYESVKISGILRDNQVAGDGDTNNAKNFYPIGFNEYEIILDNPGLVWFNNWDNDWDHDLGMTICGYGIQDPGNWAGGLKNKYLGVRFLIQGNYHYGWIAIEIPVVPNSCIIKGFAYESTPNLQIKAGETTTGINELNNFVDFAPIISPNPATDYISVSLNNVIQPIILPENTSISIFNSLGIELKRFEPKELYGKCSIDFSVVALPCGLYYCSLKVGTKIITKSFAVVR